MELQGSLEPTAIDKLIEFIDFHNEVTLRRILKFTKELLNTSNSENHKLASKLIQKLIVGIIADTAEIGDGAAISQISDSQMVVDLVRCALMLGSHCPSEGKMLLTQLDGRILAHLLNDIMRESGAECVLVSPQLYSRIQQLLQSKESEQRRSGYIILRDIFERSPTSANGQEERSARNCSEQNLCCYITLMECLEEEHSGETLNTVGTQLSILRKGIRDENWTTWTRIFYVRLLQNTNISVLCWTLEFIMDNFTAAELNEVNLLIDFLAATNRMELHNLGAYFLSDQQMIKFLREFDIELFVEALSQVPWLDVPLHHWLDCLKGNAFPVICKESFFKLSGLVSKIENKKLKYTASNRIFVLFKNTVNCLSIGELMSVVETQQLVANAYIFNNVIKKFENYENSIEENQSLSKRFFDCLINTCHVVENWSFWLNRLLELLMVVPKSQRGWLRLIGLFSLNIPKYLEFYRSEYKVNFNWNNDQELQKELILKLDCKTEEEQLFLKERSLEIFLMSNVKTWHQLEQMHLNPIDCLNNCTIFTFVYLSILLESHNERLQDEKVLETFIDLKKSYSLKYILTETILKYAAKYLIPPEREKLVEKLLDASGNRYHIYITMLIGDILPLSWLTKLLYYDTKSGIERIEDAYLNNEHTGGEWNLYKLANMPNNRLVEICDELLRINQDITIKDPLLENSTDHRVQMRIARVLTHILLWSHNWSDQLWTALLAPTNHLNIRYMYEFLVAKQLPQFGLLLEKLKTLSTLQPNQQDSVLSVVHIYCIRKWKSLKLEQLQEVFQIISQQLTCANLHTIQFAQVVLNKLAVKCEEDSIDISEAPTIKAALNLHIMDKDLKLTIKARIVLTDITQYSAETILYMTNSPYDELNIAYVHATDFSNFEMLRSAFKDKSCELNINKSLGSSIIN